MGTGNILEMPNSKNKTNKDNPLLSPLPDSLNGTSSYPMINVQYARANLRTVPDLASGGKRNKRWGVMLSLALVPGLDTLPSGPAIVPSAPSQFFDADTLELLRDRLVHEIDKAINIARLQIEDPKKFEEYYTEFMKYVDQQTEEE